MIMIINLMDYKSALVNKHYVLVKEFKITDHSAVVKLKKKKKYFVGKFLDNHKVPEYVRHTVATEIDAMKFMSKSNLPFFPKLVETWSYGNKPVVQSTSDFAHAKSVIVTEYITGNLLISYTNKKISNKSWKSLIQQLIVITYFFEQNKIIHGDFWDANLILTKIDKNIKLHFNINGKKFNVINKGFLVKVIDFQYSNQYTSKPNFISPYVLSTNPEHKEEREELGWSEKFHSGVDLNQILGILSDYEFIPSKLKELLKSIVIKREGKQFPYANKDGNPKIDMDELMKIIND